MRYDHSKRGIPAVPVVPLGGAGFGSKNLSGGQTNAATTFSNWV